MLEKLKALEDLQKVDVAIAELDRGGSENPKRLAALETDLESARSAVEAEETRLRELENQKKVLEDQISGEREKLKKWEARLAEQRSTREYSALAREIDIARKQNTTAQDELLSLAKQSEDVETVVDGKRKAYADRVRLLSGEAQEIRAAMADLSARRGTLMEKRAEVARKVDATMLRRYEVIKRNRGTVVVPIVNGACKGCNMNIPPQLNNELRTNQRLDVCPSCGRMIYSAEAFGGHGEESANP